MHNLNIKDEHLKELIDIFKDYCPNAEIWAYGSRLKGDSHPGSDLDLLIKNFGDKNCSISKLKQLLDDSNIPFLTDVLEFSSLSDSFKSEIKKNYTVIFPLDKK